MNPVFLFFTFIIFSVGTLAQETSAELPKSAAPPVATEAPASVPEVTSRAESPPATAPEAKPEEKVERVQVTGSHIRRLEAEGVSPITTISRKEIEKTGYNSVSDVLRDNTASSFGGMKEASGSNAAGNAQVDLRGLGSSNTLVLLNGQRLPTDAVTGAVDLNLIPMAAVERVEILKDGASAIYGSDALGGVVNIITRKDFKGTQVSMTQSAAKMKGGNKGEISFVNGINGEKFNTVNVIQFRKNEAIYAKNRSWSDGQFSNTGSPGSYKNASGLWIADSNCPADQVYNTPNGNYCRYRFSDHMTSLPALQQVGLLSETNYEASSKLKLVGRIGATQKKVQWSYASAPGSFTVPGAVADTLGPGGTPLPGAIPGQDLKISYRLTELGTRDTEITTNSYNLLVGGTYQIDDVWSLDTSLSHNVVDTKDIGVHGYALTDLLVAKIASGQYNPFATGSKGNIDDTKYQPTEVTHSQLTSYELKGSGSVGQMAGGPIGVAIGSTLTWQAYADGFDDKSVNGEVFGNAGSSGGGSRNTRAFFTEFSFPVTNALEVQLADRTDHYSDFGDSSNPKIGVLYHVTPTLLVRSSAGTGFKAPLMQDMYAATSNGFPTFIDAVACDAEKQAGGATPSCEPQQYQVTSSGNKNLDAEKSISYNAGVVYAPSPGFSIGTDVFLAKMTNVVGIGYGDVTEAEKAGINLANYGVVVTRDSNGYIESLDAPLQNLSSQEVSGLDLSIAYTLGKVKLSMEHAQLFYFKEEGFPGVGMKNQLDEVGRPKWRNSAGVSYLISDPQEITLTALTTAGTKQAVEGTGRLNDYTELHLHYSYKSKDSGTLTLGVKNLLGSTPPLDSSAPTAPLDATIYDQVGMQLVVGYKANF